MSTTRYNRFGQPAGYTNPIEGSPEPYLIDQITNPDGSTVLYICYYETGDGPRAIRRVVTTASGDIQVCVGWGAWADRTTIDYYPVNIVFIVDDETKALDSVQPPVEPVDPIEDSAA